MKAKLNVFQDIYFLDEKGNEVKGMITDITNDPENEGCQKIKVLVEGAKGYKRMEVKRDAYNKALKKIFQSASRAGISPQSIMNAWEGLEDFRLNQEKGIPFKKNSEKEISEAREKYGEDVIWIVEQPKEIEMFSITKKNYDNLKSDADRYKKNETIFVKGSIFGSETVYTDSKAVKQITELLTEETKRRIIAEGILFQLKTWIQENEHSLLGIKYLSPEELINQINKLME